MIRCENLCHVYQIGSPFEKAALKNINLHINKGEMLAIIGHTGSGKSTLIQHFNALELPTSGKVYIDGIDTTDKNADLKKLRSKVGLVFQYPEHQLMEETVEKDIAFGPKNLSVTGAALDERVKIAAKMVGLKDEYLSKSPFELSGGEKRRVAIAGVLAMEPDVLVLDEPTAGLDPKGRDELFELLKQLNDTGMTVVTVSHSMEDVARIAKRAIVINNGEIALDGTCEQVFSKGEFLKSIGLDIPLISEVAIKLKRAGADISEKIYTVEDAFCAVEQLIKNRRKA